MNAHPLCPDGKFEAKRLSRSINEHLVVQGEGWVHTCPLGGGNKLLARKISLLTTAFVQPHDMGPGSFSLLMKANAGAVSRSKSQRVFPPLL